MASLNRVKINKTMMVGKIYEYKLIHPVMEEYQYQRGLTVIFIVQKN